MSATEFSTLTARYAGECLLCHGTVAVGDKVRWAKAYGVKHADLATCYAVSAAADAAKAEAAAAETADDDWVDPEVVDAEWINGEIAAETVIHGDATEASYAASFAKSRAFTLGYHAAMSAARGEDR
jgi:hypothetical protein